MRLVRIENVKEGDIAGRDIINLSGHVAVKKGSSLSNGIIDRLKELGYQSVIIDDEDTLPVDVDEYFFPYRYSDKTDPVTDGNIKELCRLAVEIVDNIIRKKPDMIDVFHIQPYSDYLYCHSINTTVISVLIGWELGLDREGLYYLAKAAILHDIGMVQVPQTIRNKVSPLTDLDINSIIRHIYTAQRTLERAGISELIIDAIMSHHENENGSGYPAGLTSDDIPDFSKIIHVADVFDAMTTGKPYKRAYSVSDALDYISSGAGILFHKAVVEALLKKVAAYTIGEEVVLSNGERAVIFARTDDDFRPDVIIPSRGMVVSLVADDEYRSVFIQTEGLEVHDEVALNSNDLFVDKSRRRLVVVVDDMFICRRTVEVTLNKDYDVRCFDNAIEAINFIKKNKVDLVIMDIEMPGLSGVSAVKALRNDGFSDLPVIFLTSVNNRNTVMECLSVAARDYVLKPIKPIYIYERVREILKIQ